MGDEPDRRLQQGQRLPELQRQGRDKTAANDSGTAVSNLQWTYWALHDEDGYALLGALRTAPELAKISIILMSAAFPQRGIPPAHPAADGYLRKPFDINSVEAILDRLATQEYGH